MAVASPTPPLWQHDRHLNIHHKLNERRYVPPHNIPVWATDREPHTMVKQRGESTRHWTDRKRKALIEANDGQDHLTTLPPEVQERILEFYMESDTGLNYFRRFVNWIKLNRAACETAYGVRGLRKALKRKAFYYWKEQATLNQDIIKTLRHDLWDAKKQLDSARSTFADARRSDFERAERRYIDLQNTYKAHMQVCAYHQLPATTYRAAPQRDTSFDWMMSVPMRLS
jgi:uncharacterized protein YqeY